MTTLVFLFSGGEPLLYEKAGDANDDGEIDIADPIAVLILLFQELGPLPTPYEECGEDPKPDLLSCILYEGWLRVTERRILQVLPGL